MPQELFRLQPVRQGGGTRQPAGNIRFSFRQLPERHAHHKNSLRQRETAVLQNINAYGANVLKEGQHGKPLAIFPDPVLFLRQGVRHKIHAVRKLPQQGQYSLTARAQRPFKIPGQHIVFASRKYPADLGQDLFPLFPLEGADAVLPQGTRPVLEDELPVIPARKAPFPNTVYAVLQPLVQLRGALLALYGFVILLIEADVPAALTAVELTSGHQAVKIIVVGGTQVLVD